jgi:hypothetical protein
MSRNGSGTYNLPAGNPVVSGTTITTTWANTTLNDIASSLTGSVASDGQTPMTGALNMGSNKVISVTDPTNAQDAATKNYTDTAITTATSGLSATYLTKANNLSDVASATTSRTNLGLGTIATQAASAVAVTGGAIDGTTIGTTTRSTVKATTLDLGLSTQSVAIGQGNASIMKNRIINGAMVIDQRNAGASVSGNSVYTLDRWSANSSVVNKYTVQQNAGSVTPPVGFTNYLGITSSSAYSVAASDYFFLSQLIEGFNVADLGYGTANAKTVTLSFQVYSSLTGTFGGSFRNSAGSRGYPFSYSIPVANTWTTISITIAGDTTGTWLTTNGIGIECIFGLGVGSNLSGTAGAWAAGNKISSTGATSVVGTSGATFYITGVQLEVGSSATGFEYRLYNQELSACQRYYETSNMAWIWYGYVTNGSAALLSVPYKVTKRASTSMGLTISASSNFGGSLLNNNYGTDGATVYMVGNASGSGYYQFNWTASAEL